MATTTPKMAQDPFASREGRSLTWTNVNMTVKGSDGGGDRSILSNVWGEVPAKEISAIMGPSGAGKTSLLHILAGRSPSKGKIQSSGEVRFDGHVVNPTHLEVRQQIAFVTQDDSLLWTATPRECIRFSAKLRLSKTTSSQELDELTERMLQELALQGVADTMIGGRLVKGISGGERKRTSVGVELVVKPALVFLDEPTTGLDSFSALQVVQVLKKVAKAGSAVLFTIHQPASEIFNAFDHLLLMNKGRVMYQGSVSALPDYFRARNHPVPPNYNPADWIMNVAQSFTEEQLDNEGFFPLDKRKFPKRKCNDDIFASKSDTRVPMTTQMASLLHREMKNFTRDKKSLGMRFGVATFLSVLFGIIFNGIGGTSSAEFVNLQGHFGALVMTMLMSMFTTARPALLTFPDERPVFMREYATDHYTIVAYFFAKLAWESTVVLLQITITNLVYYWMIDLQLFLLHMVAITYTLGMTSNAIAVMLGSAVDDPKVAMEFLPMLFLPQLLFAGLLVSTSLIPVWIRWAQYLCSLTYATRIVLIAEFGDCSDDGPLAERNCQMLLENNGVDKDHVWINWLLLLALFVGCRVSALAILQRKATRIY